jgi:hypothetical protein
MSARITQQAEQKGRELVGAVGPGGFETGGVLSKLIEHDERLSAFEHSFEIARTGSCRRGYLVTECAVERFAADLVSDLAQRV